ncbi:hypothetical protein F8388_023551 [Cannabis sativa]|uniref:VQ domain-containing protein n=1 Tax=Cannabis sativa TaxID=3483 RepID=A0A7J6EG56_CANSA|nr:hypothetical protein F8388_023551 [Cannabis sativa]
MSRETLSATSNDEWIQYYHQTLLDGEEPISHNNNHDVLSGVMSSESLGSPGSSSPTASQDPQVSTPSKPVRRRSRASKKTPTTLLNANANNFRALVQQFTGCPTPISFANQKGPLNLNFGLKNATPIIERPFQNYNYQNQSHHHQPSVPQNLIHLQPHKQDNNGIHSSMMVYALPYQIWYEKNYEEECLLYQADQKANQSQKKQCEITHLRQEHVENEQQLDQKGEKKRTHLMQYLVLVNTRVLQKQKYYLSV